MSCDALPGRDDLTRLESREPETTSRRSFAARKAGAVGALLFAIVSLAPLSSHAADPCNDGPAVLNSVISISLDSSTAWQPRGGQIRFIVDSKAEALKDVEILACFRWSGPNDAPYAYLGPAPVQAVEYTSTSTTSRAVYSVLVPDKLKEVAVPWYQRFAGGAPPGSPVRFDAAMIVPLADLQIIVLDKTGKRIATSVQEVGITSVWAARTITLIAVAIAMALLYFWAKARQVPGRSVLMRLISTREGYASLSQFQIMLWSFLFGAGAVYVMGLSGGLINIPSGALVLLGIAGATTVGAKIKTANENAPSPPNAMPAPASTPPGPVTNLKTSAQSDSGVALTWDSPSAATGGPVVSYRIEYSISPTKDWRLATASATNTSFRVTRLRPATKYEFQVFAQNGAGSSPGVSATDETPAAAIAKRQPRWSDLVVTAVHPGEIDVTRVQMLFFTLISAGFVALKLFNSYVIPDIPDGFMLLMGISNGVYLSAKYVPD